MSAFAKIQYFPSLPLRFLSFLKSTRRQPHTLMLEVDKRMTKHEIKGEFYEAIWGPSGAFCLLTSESLLAGPVCCDAVLPRTDSRHLVVTAYGPHHGTPICLTQIPVPSLPSLSFLPCLEYLTKVYDLPPPHKVNTAVFKGKWRRVAGKREVVTFRHNDWKKAFVMWKRWPGEGEGLLAGKP